MTLKAGPYCDFAIGPGQTTAPFYALRFDKNGQTEGPLTQQHLLNNLAGNRFTDVYVFGHGWNNDWLAALNRYRSFVDTYRKLQADHGLNFGRDYRPIVIGIFWPSTALVLPWEQGPMFAGEDGQRIADAVDLSLLDELASDVEPADKAKLYELVEHELLGEEKARELLGIVAGAYSRGDTDLEGDNGRDIDEMLAAWASLEATLASPAIQASPDDFGGVEPGSGTTGPRAAGFLDKLNPRNLVRILTVWQMKDRAGVVGVNGVGPLLVSMLTRTSEATRYHLVGHSYGARLLLNAVSRPLGEPLSRSVHSLLLLQPAVNHLCFAETAPNGKPGGYRNALSVVKRPIMSTFSAHDFPLRNTFHLALRRGKDLGEVQIAADEPPNNYAALGGYGPRGLPDWRELPIKDPIDPYDFTDGTEVLALNGTRTIMGHGDVVNESTAWALFSVARA